MIHHHENENMSAADASGGENRDKDSSFAAYVIGASVLLGAVLISGTLLYIFKTASARLDSSESTAESTIKSAAQEITQAIAAIPAQAPSAPSGAAAQLPPLPSLPVRSKSP